MPIITAYLFAASMDVDPEKEALFNEVYDTEHIPNLLKVPGVHAVTRLKGEAFAVSIGGGAQQATHTGPRYSALYETRGRTCLSAPRGPRRRTGALAQPGPALHQPSAARALSALLATGLRCAPEQRAREKGGRHVRSDHPACPYL
jgi:hypothetical protein